MSPTTKQREHDRRRVAATDEAVSNSPWAMNALRRLRHAKKPPVNPAAAEVSSMGCEFINLVLW